MQNIGSILEKYKKPTNDPAKKTRPINPVWEQAQDFGKYVGMPTTAVMRLFKLYGMGNVLGIKSWLYDIPYDKNRGGKIALAHWKLKELKKIKK